MQSQICYNRIIRKYVRNKYKYYVQIIFKGNPPVKVDTETGEIITDYETLKNMNANASIWSAATLSDNNPVSTSSTG